MCVLCPTRDCGVNDVLIVGFLQRSIGGRLISRTDVPSIATVGQSTYALPSQSTHVRDEHGLGPSMGWVGLDWAGWVAFSSTCDGFGGLG